MTFAEFCDELNTEALNAWQAVKNEAATLAAEFEPVVEADLIALFAQLKTIAINTVMQLAQLEFNNLTGAQKNSITVNTIVQAAIAAGKTVAIQDAALLAQQAYNAVASTAPGK